MSTTVERTYEVPADIEEVWELIADPTLRAEAISVVERFHQEGDETIWAVAMPVRGIPGTVSVRTRDVERDPPRYVRFVGESSVMTVEGEHELETSDEGCLVFNRFIVDGRFPGVERFFKRNIDDEIDNLLQTVADRLAAQRRE